MNDIKNKKNNGALGTDKEIKTVRQIYSEIQKFVKEAC